MPGSIDMSQWPTWLLVTLLIINLFREQIGAFIPQALREHFTFRAKRKADKEEHQQQTEDTLLQSKLKAEDELLQSKLEAEQELRLRKSWREEQWVEILKQKDSWIQEELDGRLKENTKLLGKILEQMSNVRTNGIRTNDLLTSINSSLTRIADTSPGKVNYSLEHLEDS